MYQNERKFSFIVVICDLDGSSKCTGSLEQPEQFDNPEEHVGFNEEDLYDSDVEMDFSNEIANHDVENVIKHKVSKFKWYLLKSVPTSTLIISVTKL
jgi:hypothetical protein